MSVTLDCDIMTADVYYLRTTLPNLQHLCLGTILLTLKNEDSGTIRYDTVDK